MPEWSPLQVGVLAGIVCAVLWTARTIAKSHSIAGFFMVIERRFWRSLVLSFAVAFVISGLLVSLLATILWLLHGLVLRLV